MTHVDVSVLITNYNHEQLLPECLDAVFSQSVLPREVIVIDDASPRDCTSVIRQYQNKYPELIFLQNSVNQGPARAMTRAIQHAKGKYVVLAAADDFILPGFLEEAARCLDRYPEAGICCSKPSFFKNEKPYVFWETSICNEQKTTFIPADKMQQSYLHTPLWIPTHASLYRRNLIVKYGCLEDGLKHICDWYLNCKIALNHGIVYTPHSFGAFRVSGQSYGATWRRSYRKKIGVYQHLFSMLAHESDLFQTQFRKSGTLGLVAADVLLYLATHPARWKYIFYALYRKSCNFFRFFCKITFQ